MGERRPSSVSSASAERWFVHQISDESDHRFGDRLRVLLIAGGADGHEHAQSSRRRASGSGRWPRRSRRWRRLMLEGRTGRAVGRDATVGTRRNTAEPRARRTPAAKAQVDGPCRTRELGGTTRASSPTSWTTRSTPSLERARTRARRASGMPCSVARGTRDARVARREPGGR
jgi:hypothetical protein